MKLQVGDTIRIIEMQGEPQYSGRTGVIRSIDDAGQLHGDWGGLAVIPGEDRFEIVDLGGWGKGSPTDC